MWPVFIYDQSPARRLQSYCVNRLTACICENLLLETYKNFKMPKASKSAPSVQHTIEKVLSKESDQEEISSDQEVFLTPNLLQVTRHKKCQV